MPQILKDEIKDKISKAAFDNFANKGFKNTSMSTIAKAANISVGNIYRYYVNKEDIFYSLITPGFVNKFKSTMQMRMQTSGGHLISMLKNSEDIDIINQDVIDFYFEHRLHIVILLNNCYDTAYENIKEELRQMTIDYIINYFENQNEDEDFIFTKEKRFLIALIYENLINGIIEILKEFETREEIETAYRNLFSYHLFGLSSLMK